LNAARVVVEGELHGEDGDVHRDVVGRGRDRGVDEDHCCPAIQLGQQVVEPGFAEVTAVVVRREQDHSVWTQHVERVGGLLEGAVDVRKRHGGEEPEAHGVRTDDLGR